MRKQARPSSSRSQHGSRIVAALAATALCALPLTQATTATAAPAPLDTGFAQPFAGTPKFLHLAPTQAARNAEINMPLGQKAADRLAKKFGFDKSKAFSKKKYAKYMAAKGTPRGVTQAEARKAVELTKVSVNYLTNTNANTYTRIINGEKITVNLGSYGLIVTSDGRLESPANPTSPVRQINWVLAPEVICAFPEASPPPGIPCGYMGKWMRQNGAKDTLSELYESAYTKEVVYGSRSQGNQDPWGIAPNVKKNGTVTQVGMAMAPSIWIVNFLLIYALSPTKAAKMPAFWEPLPDAVADALVADPPAEGMNPGQVPYGDYMSYFTN